MIERFHGGLREDSLDFSINLNPFIDESVTRDLVCKYYKKAIKYPEQRGKSLIQSISNKYNIPEENIILGNGSIEIFYLLPRVLQVDKIFTLEPTFSEYRYVAKINKCDYVPIKPVFEFEWDMEKLSKRLDKKSLLFICNPNNPTGNLFERKKILKLLKTGAFIVVDEAFIDFTLQNESLIKDVINFKNLIVVKSLTKIYSIAGLRIGFCVASKKIVRELNRNLPLWNVNSLALAISKDFLLNDDLIINTKRLVKKEKEFIFKSFENCSYIKLFDTHANFFLARSDKTPELINFLSSNNIAVREYKGFYGLDKKYFRFAIKKHEENEQLVDLIKKFYSFERTNI